MDISEPLAPITILGVTINEGSGFAGGKSVTIFNKSQFERIRSYVKAGTNIREELYSIIAMLENQNPLLDGIGFLQRVNKNCREWPALENDISYVASSLCLYGKKAVLLSGNIIAQIEAMPIMQKLRTIGDIPEALSFDGKDKSAKLSLSKLLSKLRNEAVNCKLIASDANKKIEKYRLNMDNEIMPRAAAIRNAAALIPPLAAKRSISGKTYEINVPHGKFLESRPITESILQKFNGASTVQEISEAMKLAADYFTPVSESISLAFIEVTEIYNCVSDSALGIRALETFWDTIVSGIDSAKKELDGMDDSTKLLNFLSGIKVYSKLWQSAADAAEKFSAVSQAKQ